MERYEKKIIELQNENQILRQEYKSHIFSSNKERETLMNTIQRERNFINQKNLSEDSKRNKNKKMGKKEKNELPFMTETSANLIEYPNNNNRNKYKKYADYEKIKEKGKKIEKLENLSLFSDDYFIKKISRKQFEHEDFIDILKNVGLTLEKFEYMSKLKSYSKFTEIIEMLLNLVKEKERHLSILKKENEYLNENNFKLNEENILLTNKIKLKEKLIRNNNQNENNNNSDLNPKLKKTMNLYKEYLDNNQKEDSSPSDVIYDIKPNILKKQMQYTKILSNGDNFKKEEENNDTIIYNNDYSKNEDKNINNYVEENIKNINIKEEGNMAINNKNITAVKIPNEILAKNFGNNKFLGTLMSVTSSEFKEGCPGPDSFLSTMKFDDMSITQKTNGLKEIQKTYINNNQNNQ
jgi:hypothetical protein